MRLYVSFRKDTVVSYPENEPSYAAVELKQHPSSPDTAMVTEPGNATHHIHTGVTNANEALRQVRCHGDSCFSADLQSVLCVLFDFCGALH